MKIIWNGPVSQAGIINAMANEDLTGGFVAHENKDGAAEWLGFGGKILVRAISDRGRFLAVFSQGDDLNQVERFDLREIEYLAYT